MQQSAEDCKGIQTHVPNRNKVKCGEFTNTILENNIHERHTTQTW